VRYGRLIPALALGLAVHSAAAQSTSGKPMDADDFEAQSSQNTGVLQPNPMMQQVIKQGLAPATPQQIQAAQQQMQAAPPQPKGPTAMWALGISNKTCKDLLNPTTKSLGLEAESWAQGFWTGLNTLDPRNHNVGKDADPKSIILDITTHCSDNPAESLMQSVSEIYAQYLNAGK
jgi:hypothetical protein